MSMIMMIERVASEATQLRSVTASMNSANSWNPDHSTGVSFGNENVLCLEKAWHGLHYLLAGDPWAGIGYRGFLIHGGQQVGDGVYGPIRLFAAEEVVEISKLLDSFTSDQLWSGYSQERFESADIYPDIWEESEDVLREEYIDYFNMLREFVSQTATDGIALQVSLV